MNALVAYYSRTGTTKKVAEEISKSLMCDVEAISDNKRRSGIAGYLRCGFEGVRKKTPKINEAEKKASEHDIVIVGTPIWGGNMSSLTRSYISRYSKDFKKVAFFCTQGGSGAEKALKEMGEMCGKEPVAVLGLIDKEVNEGMYIDKIKRFVAEIRKS